ncbi:MAG: iron-containing alcohol dehydrogenase [Chloroflexi bacterium]|nr:iron-containing alcohol dehydrogenase [Chloroflexota bacterium]MBL7061125.1 iron-containing alcohol dehydrogenase [Dehalococcoidia bacterium]
MWYFVVPEVVFGQDALTRLAELQGKSAFIVTDKNIVSLGFVDKVKEQLSQAGIKSNVFDEVEPDPSLQTVKKGVALMNQYGPDLVVAVGGGSVMDAAKAMRVEYERPDLKAEEINPFISDLGLGAKCKLVCIPTTSGTGAEATFAIVLTDTDDQRKLSLINREIATDIAIVDPALAAAMPAGLTSSTGMDVLTHAVEAFSCTWKNDFTDGLCIRAIQLVFEYLPRAVKDGQDMEAREKMHNAATIAGIGFTNSLTAMAHATGHSLGAVFHVPHGRAVGLLLPYTIEFVGDIREDIWAEISYALKLNIPKGEKAGLVLARAIRGLANSIKEPLSLKELGIPVDKLDSSMDKLIDNAMADGSLIVSARVPSVAETEKFLRYAYEGKSIDF